MVGLAVVVVVVGVDGGEQATWERATLGGLDLDRLPADDPLSEPVKTTRLWRRPTLKGAQSGSSIERVARGCIESAQASAPRTRSFHYTSAQGNKAPDES